MGTQAADRSAQQGAASILWPYERRAEMPDGANGSFTRDGGALPW
jgi:hypothetical protein